MKRVIHLLLILGTLFASTSCKPPSPPPPPPNGFLVKTYDQTFVNEIPTTPPIPAPLTGFTSRFIFTTKPTNGTLTDCTGTTDATASFPCPDRKVPAVWEFKFTSGFCFTTRPIATDFDVDPGSTVHFICERHTRQFFFSPSSIDVNASPATVEVTGDGLYSTYGMPVIEFVNTWTGNIVASTTASAISADGTWIQAPTPYLGSQYSGQYAALVYNVTADGSLEVAGGATLDLYGNEPPPPPDPDPCGTSGTGVQMPCTEIY